MPKTYSMAKKNEWLKRYEEGALEAEIARECKSDLRTIRKGIEQARRQKEAAAARTQLLVNSFTQHQADLIKVVDSLAHSMIFPGADVDLRLNEDGFPEKVLVDGSRAVFQGGDRWKIVLSEEESPLYELLKDHLKRDPIWKRIETWKTALAAHLQARVALKRKARDLLEEGTGFKLVADNKVGSRKSFVYTLAVDFFYRIVLDQALRAKRPVDLTKRIRVTSAGYVEYGHGNPVLAYAPREPEKTKESILKAFRQLSKSPEVDRIRSTRTELQVASTEAGRVLQEITLLRMVPGQCRVCRRLGM